MLILGSTSDKVQVVTDAATPLDVHASYADYDGATVTAGRKNTQIAAVATTDVVPAPAASVERNLKSLTIRNTHGSSSVTVTIQQVDPSQTVTMASLMLAAQEELSYIDGKGFRHLDAAGRIKTALQAQVDALSQSLSVLSQAISVVSQALSAEISNRTSADNALSNALSQEASVRTAKDDALSQSLSVVSQAISVLSQAVSVVSQALSVETSNRTSADNALSNALSNEASIRAAKDDAQSQSLSVLSQAVSVVSQALSVETSNRISADNALSDKLSQLSQSISALSQGVSVVSQALSNEISNRTSADNALSNVVSGVSVQAASAISQLNSVVSQGLSLLSQGISVVSQALSNEISNRTSADNALSNTISNNASIVSQLNSVVSQGLSLASQKLSQLSQSISVLSQALSAVSARTTAGASVHGLQSVVDALSSRISQVAGGGGGGSVTSTELSAASAQATSAISQLNSIVSQGLSLHSQQISVLTMVANVVSLQNLDTNMSAGNVVRIFSVDAFQRAAYKAGDTASTFAIGILLDSTPLSGIGRVQIGGMVSLPTTVWDGVTSDLVTNGLSTTKRYYLNSVAGKITYLPSNSDIIVGYAQSHTALLLNIGRDWSQALSTVSNGVSVVSNAVSAASAQAASAISQLNSVVSQGLSLASNKLSQLSQSISVLSQAVSVISQLISTFGFQVRTFVTTGLTVSAATLTNIPSLSLSMAAGMYQIEGQLLFECATSGGFAFGASLPALSAALGGIMMNVISVTGQNTAAPTGAAVMSAVAAGQTAIASVSVATVNQPLMMKFDGLLNVSAAGTFQLMARTSVAGASMIVRSGFVRGWKIG